MPPCSLCIIPDQLYIFLFQSGGSDQIFQWTLLKDILWKTFGNSAYLLIHLATVLKEITQFGNNPYGLFRLATVLKETIQFGKIVW